MTTQLCEALCTASPVRCMPPQSLRCCPCSDPRMGACILAGSAAVKALLKAPLLPIVAVPANALMAAASDLVFAARCAWPVADVEHMLSLRRALVRCLLLLLHAACCLPCSLHSL